MTIATASQRTTSKSISSIHYSGPLYSGITGDLINGEPGIVTSKFPLSYGFRNPSSAQTWPELMDFSITPYGIANKDGKIHVVMSTVYNKFSVPIEDFLEYGFIHNPDESKNRMDGWKSVTEKSNALAYVKVNPERGLIKGHEFVPSYRSSSSSMTDVNVPITNLEGVVPINDVGKYLSTIGNLEADLRNALYRDRFHEKPDYNPETEALFKLMISEGAFPRDIVGIGVMDLEDAVAMAVIGDNTANLIVSKNFYEHAKATAEMHGLRGEDAVEFVKNAVIYHELLHINAPKIASRKKEEIRVGSLGAKFYETRSSMLKERLARYSKAMQQYNKSYVSGIKSGAIKLHARANLENLAENYALQAKAMGMNEEEVADYVAAKIDDEIERLESNASNENGETTKRKKTTKEKSEEPKNSSEDDKNNMKNKNEDDLDNVGTDDATNSLPEAA
ncbi:hypothetical protein HYX01_01655 [Candidatus Woesearchaeota archaeon]|nr:hypothetical protein [Candidatus Woesearchaeota archaeon]